VPLVYDSHELWTEQASLVERPFIRAFWCWLERRLISRVDHTIAVSASIGGILAERYGLERVTILRNLPPSRPPLRSNRIRSELRLAEDCVILLYQGGFLTDNGLSEQIAAMAAVDSAALVLIGSGPVEEQLRQQVADAGLTERVHFLARVPFPALHEYTCSADVGLCLIKPSGSSFYYSLPNKLFEYMQAGLPILACESPEIRAVMEETGAGQMVDPADVDAIGRHLRELVSDPELRKRYSAASLRSAPSYTWEKDAEKLVSLYSSLHLGARGS
jgi:glycosyltransferase involved in cell wall biosynthesis